jgi:hypothetical protein
VAGGDSIFTVMTGGSATLIAGQNILFLPGTTVFPGGYMHGYITNDSQYCPTVPPPVTGAELKYSEQLNMVGSGSMQKIILYPNPVQDFFTVESTGYEPTQITGIEIFSINGTKVFSAVYEGVSKQTVSTIGFKPGIYFLKISSTTINQTFKLIRL